MSSPLTPENIETSLQIVGESLCEAVDVTAGSQIFEHDKNCDARAGRSDRSWDVGEK